MFTFQTKTHLPPRIEDCQNSKPAKAYEELTKEVIKDAERRRDKAAIVR